MERQEDIKNNVDRMTLMMRSEIEVGKRWCYPSMSQTTFCSISFDGTRPIMIVDFHVIIMRSMLMKTGENNVL